MMNRLCEVCNLVKDEIAFKVESTICKKCAVVAGVQDSLQRKRRRDVSSLDNKMCRKFLQQHLIKPTGWELTL